MPPVEAVQLRVTEEVDDRLAASPVTGVGGVADEPVVALIMDETVEPELLVAMTSRSYSVSGLRLGTETDVLVVGEPTSVKVVGSAIRLCL